MKKPFIRINTCPIEMVEREGMFYRCEITARHNIRLMPRCVYHGRAVIATLDGCACYEVDRNSVKQPYIANIATKKGSVNGGYPLDAPIALETKMIHESEDLKVTRFAIWKVASGYSEIQKVVQTLCAQGLEPLDTADYPNPELWVYSSELPQVLAIIHDLGYSTDLDHKKEEEWGGKTGIKIDR